MKYWITVGTEDVNVFCEADVLEWFYDDLRSELDGDYGDDADLFRNVSYAEYLRHYTEEADDTFEVDDEAGPEVHTDLGKAFAKMLMEAETVERVDEISKAVNLIADTENADDLIGFDDFELDIYSTFKRAYIKKIRKG